MARMKIKLAHDLRDETLRASKKHVERAHVDVDMISSFEQTTAGARAHRRGAPQETESR